MNLALRLIAFPCLATFFISRWPSVLARGEDLSASISYATLLAGLLATWSAYRACRWIETQAVSHQDVSQDKSVAGGDQVSLSIMSWHIRKPHIIQTLAQGAVYVAWCIAWPTAMNHLPLLLAQIAFAYLIDMAIGWKVHHTYRLGLSPIPIVLSTNLFLFFIDDYFEWQWALIGFALVSREVFRWRRGGRSVHIFNPSAIALSLFALILILTDQMHLTWGEAIARTHGFSPYSYEVIFAAGLLVSSFFTVGFTIASSAVCTLLLGQWYFDLFSVYRYLDTGIPIAVFLGMNLLVTDPVSSPWRRDAKIVYGALYGLSVFVLYGLLRDLERPPTPDDVGLSAAFCDKLLAVPLLNLLSPSLDGIMKRVFGDEYSGISQSILRMERSLLQKSGRTIVGRVVFVMLWVITFIAWIRPSVREHPGKDVQFWVKACEETSAAQRHPYSCENRDRIYLRACESGALPACHNLALTREEKDPKLALHLYEHACNGELAESCNHLGGMLFIQGDKAGDLVLIKEAERRLTFACEHDAFEACTRLATLQRSPHIDRSQWTVKRWTELWTLLNRACDGGEPYACFELSQMNLIHPQGAQVRCQRGERLFCSALEERQRTTRREAQANASENVHARQSPPGVQSIFRKARTQLSTACSAQIKLACINLAWMTWRGDGGEQSIESGLKLMDKMCQGGERVACQRLTWMKQNPAPVRATP